MNLKVKLFIPVVTVITLVALISMYISKTVITDLVKNQIQQKENLLLSEIEETAVNHITRIYNNIDRIAKKALGEATLFSTLPQVQDAYRVALGGDIHNERDSASLEGRKLLREFIKPVIEAHKRDTGLDQCKLHFHLPSNRSLLRVWREGWQINRDGRKLDVSDDLSSFRSMVVEINQGNHQALKGIEVGRGGLVIRGITPITAPDGAHLGSNEIFFPFKSLLNVTEISQGINIAAYMKADLLSVATRLKDPVKFPVLDGRYVLTVSTDNALTSSLIASDLLDRGTEKPFSRLSDNYYLTSFPIKDFSGKTVGVMAMFQDLSPQKAIIANMRKEGERVATDLIYKVMLGAVLTASGIVLLLWFVVSKTILNPLAKSIHFASRVSRGDFTRTLDICQKDEIGTLAGALNTMVKELGVMFKRIKNSSQNLSVSSLDLSLLSQQISDGVNQTLEQSGRVTASAMDMSHNMDSVAAFSEQTTTNVNMVAAAAEEMSVTIEEIAHNAQKAHGITTKAVSRARRSSEKMARLGEAAHQISHVAESITEISEQTNLLALNATIEAARAGEAGKGFTVVAGEIKNLAKQTADATREIMESIEMISLSTRETVDEMDEITAIIDDINGVVSSIAVSVDEQSSTTREIAENVGQASQGISEVNDNMLNTSGLAGEIAGDIEGVAGIARDAGGNMEHIGAYVNKLMDISEVLNGMTEKFQFGEERFDIKQVKKAHLEWATKLTEAIKGQIVLKPDEVVSHRDCEFGKWYSGALGRTLVSHSAYKKVGEHHERVHDICTEIAVLIQQGEKIKMSEAMKRFTSERLAFFETLDELYLS